MSLACISTPGRRNLDRHRALGGQHRLDAGSSSSTRCALRRVQDEESLRLESSGSASGPRGDCRLARNASPVTDATPSYSVFFTPPAGLGRPPGGRYAQQWSDTTRLTDIGLSRPPLPPTRLDHATYEEQMPGLTDDEVVSEMRKMVSSSSFASPDPVCLHRLGPRLIPGGKGPGGGARRTVVGKRTGGGRELTRGPRWTDGVHQTRSAREGS